MAVSNSISGQKNEAYYYKAYNKLIPNWYDDKKFMPITDEKKIALRKKYNISLDVIIVTSLGGIGIIKIII